MALADYSRFIRFKYHITFISVIAGAVLFAEELAPSLAIKLALLYVSFNIFLYGGLYTINDIADIEADKKHQLKRKRPLSSGKVSVKSASAFATALIAAGLLSGLVFGMPVFAVYLAIVVLNISYTFAAKKVPYLELVVNSATHPLRFLMGVLLVSNALPHLLLLAIFALAFGLACVRRAVEMDVRGWEARKVLKAYSPTRLLLLQLLAFLSIIAAAMVDAALAKAYYVIIAAVYCALVFGIYFSGGIRGIFRSIWTR